MAKAKRTRKKTVKHTISKSKSATKKIRIEPAKKRWHAAPLKGSFMLTAMLGFLISAYWVYPQSFNYGVAFMLVFAAMFIASLISMTKAPVLYEKR